MFLTSLLGALRSRAGRAGPDGLCRPGRNVLAARRMRLEPLESRMLLSLAPEWVIGMTDGPSMEVYSTAVGPDGDVYVAGRFHETADFDPNENHAGDPDILTSAGSFDGFVARYTSDGDFVWATSMGSPGGGGGAESASGIDVDRDGNVYVAGTLSGTAQLGDDTLGPGLFVTRLDSSGAFDWAVTAASTDVVVYTRGGITVDDSHPDSANWSVYSVGSFAGEGQVGDQPVDSGLSYRNDGYVLKLKAAEATGGDSQFIWTQVIDGSGDFASPGGIALAAPANPGDEATLYLTGGFTRRATFGDLRLTAASHHGGEKADIFVAKMDSDGNFLWAERMGGVGADNGMEIAVDDGCAYVTGHFGDGASDIYKTADFGDFTLTAAGEWDGFVMKVDADGNVLWAQQVGADYRVYGVDIAVGASHDIFLSGDFVYNVTFPNGIELTDEDADGFLAQIDAQGDFLSVWQLGGDGGPGGAPGDGVAADIDGNVYVSGHIFGTAEFPTGDVLSTDDGYRTYLMKFAPGPPSFSIDDVTLGEGDSGTTSFTFTVTRSGNPSQEVNVDYATADGTATVADNDYVGVGTTTLIFQPGQTSQPIVVTVNGDTSEEGNETFFVNLSNAQGATIADGQGVGTILDDDAPVQPETYTSTDTPQEIADPHRRKGPRPTTSEIDVTSNDMIASLVVDVDITHGAEAGLSVTLESSSSSIGAQTLSYDSPTDTWSLADPDAFVGEALGGTWTLTVTDEVREGNTGTLESWSLTVTPQAAAGSSSTSLLADVDGASFEGQSNDALLKLLAADQVARDRGDSGSASHQGKKGNTLVDLALLGLVA